jgi:hypothetical protein
MEFQLPTIDNNQILGVRKDNRMSIEELLKLLDFLR